MSSEFYLSRSVSDAPGIPLPTSSVGGGRLTAALITPTKPRSSSGPRSSSASKIAQASAESDAVRSNSRSRSNLLVRSQSSTRRIRRTEG